MPSESALLPASRCPSVQRSLHGPILLLSSARVLQHSRIVRRPCSRLCAMNAINWSGKWTEGGPIQTKAKSDISDYICILRFRVPFPPCSDSNIISLLCGSSNRKLERRRAFFILPHGRNSREISVPIHGGVECGWLLPLIFHP